MRQEKKETLDLEREQKELLELMEASIDSETLDAIQKVYDSVPNHHEEISTSVSYEGTVCA